MNLNKFITSLMNIDIDDVCRGKEMNVSELNVKGLLRVQELDEPFPYFGGRHAKWSRGEQCHMGTRMVITRQRQPYLVQEASKRLRNIRHECERSSIGCLSHSLSDR